jgi:hypothetical protein
MSIATRTKRLISPGTSTSSSPSVTHPILHHDAEAPEQARLEREAPESRKSCWAEAPDAGAGRAGLLEHEFTHGRSQS